MDLTELLVERVVVHSIPRKEPKAAEEQQEELRLSEAVSPLPPGLQSYMTLQLQGSLQSADKAFDVVFDPAADTPIPAEVRDYLKGETGGAGTEEQRNEVLVELSQNLAQRLFDVQPPQAQKGLLAVCSGTLGQRSVVAIMKLEHEKGVTVGEETIEGKRTVVMTVEDELVLTAGTKVFKAAAFAVIEAAPTAPPEGTAELDCEAKLSDTQNPFRASTVAAYFSRDCLGVKLASEPRVTTERVFRVAEAVLNREIGDPAPQVLAERALVAEMAANKAMFSPQAFGNQHLDPDVRAALRDELLSHDLPTTGFPKDTELIDGRLKMIGLSLDGDITVVAPQDRFDDETIVVSGSQNGDTAHVTINAGLRTAHARGR